MYEDGVSVIGQSVQNYVHSYNDQKMTVHFSAAKAQQTARISVSFFDFTNYFRLLLLIVIKSSKAAPNARFPPLDFPYLFRCS